MSQTEETPGSLPEQVEVEEVQRLLEQITAVRGCRVVCNEWGAVEEIHILSDTSRHPKQIVRDVESALAARWDLSVDHKKISVAQVDDREKHPSSRSYPEQISLVSVNVGTHLVESTMEAQVTIQWFDGEQVEGNHVGSTPARHTGRIAAKAAVAAVRGKLGSRCSLTLEDLYTANMAGGDVTLCQLGFSSSRGEPDILAGCAVIDSDDRTYAAIKAVINAVNSNRDLFN